MKRGRKACAHQHTGQVILETTIGGRLGEFYHEPPLIWVGTQLASFPFADSHRMNTEKLAKLCLGELQGLPEATDLFSLFHYRLTP